MDTIQDLPTKEADVYADYDDFLERVATWVRRYQNMAKGLKSWSLAVTAIRKANDVWGGVGVYTVVEIFFLAGPSKPYLITL